MTSLLLALTVLTSILSGSTAVLLASPVQAESNDAASGITTWVPDDGATFYAYVRVGETIDAGYLITKLRNGNGNPETRITVTNPLGAVAYTCSVPAGTAIGGACQDDDMSSPATGIWKIQYDKTSTGPTAWAPIDWNISVRNSGGTEIPGRVWTNRYRINQSPTGADLRYWVVNDGGYQYDIRLKNYNGAQSTLQPTAVGNVTQAGSCIPAYRSLEYEDRQAPGADCGIYRIFFSHPAADLPATANSPDGILTVAPAPLTSADLAVDDLTFEPAGGAAKAGKFEYSIPKRFSGGYSLEIDANGDGDYSDSVDRRIRLGADGSGNYSYMFDGRNGLGPMIDQCSTINARIYYDKVGEMHVLNEDVEGRDGIQITRLNGPAAPDSKIYWDDRALSEDRDSTTPSLNGKLGVNSSTAVHGWDYRLPGGWGDERNIEDWTFVPQQLGTGETTISGNCLDLEKTSDATADTRARDTVTYEVTATNTGDTDYTSADPAVIFDDLSDVLDDADYNADATSDRGAAPSYAEPLLSWSGALPAGQSVTLKYSVTLNSDGDSDVRNIAWVPGDPDDPTVPSSCTGGSTPAGELCDEVRYPLPKLQILKEADRTQVSAAGDEVTYTITVKNVGSGAYTASAPASMTDDLSDVLDNATFDGQATATAGTVDYDEPKLSWSGPLAAGASAEVSYTVTYNGEGDRNLHNVACVPESEVAQNADACASVTVPGSQLSQWKMVTASTDPAMAGTVLTYTLFFHNDGPAAATVDAIDDLTQVTDDATVTTEPSSANGLTTSRDGNKISVTGSVPANTTRTVTYKVTVKPDGQRGDDIATNFLLHSGEKPPPGSDCEPEDSEAPDCTATPIVAIAYSKSVEASTDPVDEGTVLTYTITIKNIGDLAAPVSREDVLTDVLDDAELTSDPVSDTGSVTVSVVNDGRFEIGGELGADGTAKVTYQMTVKAESDRGNNQADNFLVPPGGTPPTECVSSSDQCTSTPLPLIEASKSVDPDSGSTVVAGQDVTYTLTFHNAGKADGAVDYTDYLSDIVDDATLTEGPTASNDALTATLGAEDTIGVSGILAKDQTVMVTYTVRVLPDDQRGDNHLGNFLMEKDEEPPAECVEVSTMCTENPIPEIVSWKGVEANESPVKAGTVLTYTLSFENIGKAAGELDEIDDLTHVTDDASVTTEPTSADGLAASRDGNRIAITGDVPAGKTYTVTYQVTVKADDERGDDIAANFLMPNDPEDPPVPPIGPVCQPKDNERPDCTVTPIGKLLTTKSVSASTDPVDVGTVLTYTLTFDNQGKGPVEVDKTDILTDVLDDTTLTTAPVASDDALSVSAVTDGKFTTTGELTAGKKVTVTYQVTVNAESERGNNTADNFLVTTGEDPPEECVEDDRMCTETPLPLIEVEKSSDPETGSDMQAGQDVTYTLTFTNTGEAAGPVDYTDDLAAVLDDADLTGAPQSSDPALVATDGADGAVRVTGILEPEQEVTVSYTVTVVPDGERGDDLLRNVVAKTGTEDPQCDDESVSCTEHPVGELDDWKSVDPAMGSTLRPGQEATYTLHFENTGKAPVEVNRDDVLTRVLDDAEVTAEPVSSSDALTVTAIDDERFTVAGSLEPGDLVTVDYTVKVKADGERGDDRLDNFLVPNGEEPPEGTCVPADEERPDCTYNHVSDVSVVKSSDPKSGSEIDPGEEVTYTLTFTNRGINPDAADVEVDYTDYMVDVLDDAELVAGPKVSHGDLTAGTDGDTIHITGAVPTGGVYTVSYTVKVKAYDKQGDHQLANVVAITGEEPVCAPGSQLCTEHEVPEPPEGSWLPNTGAEISVASLIAVLLLLGAGGGLVLTGRRRNT